MQPTRPHCNFSVSYTWSCGTKSQPKASTTCGHRGAGKVRLLGTRRFHFACVNKGSWNNVGRVLLSRLSIVNTKGREKARRIHELTVVWPLRCARFLNVRETQPQGIEAAWIAMAITGRGEGRELCVNVAWHRSCGAALLTHLFIGTL